MTCAAQEATALKEQVEHNNVMEKTQQQEILLEMAQQLEATPPPFQSYLKTIRRL